MQSELKREVSSESTSSKKLISSRDAKPRNADNDAAKRLNRSNQSLKPMETHVMAKSCHVKSINIPF